MKDRIVLITKDAMCKNYLPIYGNQSWHMPNLEELASKGTVFNRFYTAAPSTAMSFISMFLHKNPYETDHKKYVAVKMQEDYTVFDSLYQNGYKCHIIWDNDWVKMAKKFSECYGKNTHFNLLRINQTVGAHNLYSGKIYNNDDVGYETITIIEDEVKEIIRANNDKLFLWIHLPHVLLGRNCYGSDMDLFDQIIGIMRKFFPDNAIYISADHGNMNGIKNKICYGFDVYEPAINIPLITPRVGTFEQYDRPVSNAHLFEIIYGTIPEDKFVYSDSAYYAQPHRKLAIIHDNFKYIYNKRSRTEELYDLKFDPNENCNIISQVVYDVDRKIKTPLNEVYYYPYWNDAEKEREILRQEFQRIWREESAIQKVRGVFDEKARIIYRRLLQRKA